MAVPKHIYVFTYDIARDSRRAKAAEILGTYLVRVQKSVFEGRLTPTAARALCDRVAALLSAEDSLRAYAVTRNGRADTIVHGDPPLSEAADFFLL